MLLKKNLKKVVQILLNLGSNFFFKNYSCSEEQNGLQMWKLRNQSINDFFINYFPCLWGQNIWLTSFITVRCLHVSSYGNHSKNFLITFQNFFLFWHIFSCQSRLTSTDEWWIFVNPDVQGWLGCVSMLTWYWTFIWWYCHLNIIWWSLNFEIYSEKSRNLTSGFIIVNASLLTLCLWNILRIIWKNLPCYFCTATSISCSRCSQ